jgi:AcrR family transcriptional regulator
MLSGQNVWRNCPLEESTDAIDRRILEAAERLFVQFGFDKTTLNDVAKEADVARSTLYARYKRKEDVFTRLMSLHLRVFTEAWLTHVEDDPDGGSFAGIFKAALLAIYANPFILALYKNDRQVMGSFINQFETGNFYQQRQALNHLFLSQMQVLGMVRADLDVEAFAYVANCLHFGILKLSDIVPQAESPPLERILAMIVEIVERTVAPERGGSSVAGKQMLREYTQVVMRAIDQWEQQLMARTQDTERKRE